MGEKVSLALEDGRADAYVALPEAGRGPGVLVCHAWWGMTGFVTGLCDRLAAEGFVALTADMYGGRTARTVEEAEALVDDLSSAHGQAVATAALDALAAHPAVQGERLGVVGFSLGAAYALLLGAWRPEQVGAIVAFYGTAGSEGVVGSAPVLGHYAPSDEWEPDEVVQAVEQSLHSAGREVTFHRYEGAGHWFFEIDRPDAYDAAAAELAWERTLAFLRQHLTAQRRS